MDGRTRPFRDEVTRFKTLKGFQYTGSGTIHRGGMNAPNAENCSVVVWMDSHFYVLNFGLQ